VTPHMNPLRVAQVAALVRQLEREREAAARAVERIVVNTPRENWGALAEHPDLRTVGALERVGTLFATALAKDPSYAHALAELAVSVAERLPLNAYPSVILSQLRVHAWKDLGKALRFLGRNRDAVKAFQIAEEQTERQSVLAHDRAIVRFNLAYSLQELERYDEAIAALVECKQVFRDHGDTDNVVLVCFAEGVLLQRLKRFREAREIYLLLLASTRDLDTETVAAIHHAIGFCSVDLRDFDDAEANFQYAMSLHRQAGQPVHLLKAELGRGRLLIRKGEPASGVTHLRHVRRAFLRNGLHEEAGLCGLEIVEGLLLLDRASEAETLARKIVGEFTVADLNTRAITALGYLTQAITMRKAGPALASHVREYIVSLRAKPEREFMLTI
jgi:tetratricopeptide (TPR) repeat protein